MGNINESGLSASVARGYLMGKGIEAVNAESWYPWHVLLDLQKLILQELGPDALFTVGTNVPGRATFPPEVDTLDMALLQVVKAYPMNHRGGDIGFYKLLRFEADGRWASMECHTPYSRDFERGLFYAMTQKYLPEQADSIVVTSHPFHLNEQAAELIIKW